MQLRRLLLGLCVVPLLGFSAPTTTIHVFNHQPPFYITIFKHIFEEHSITIRLVDNEGGYMKEEEDLQQAIEHAKGQVLVISNGYVESAGFDLAFGGRPSRIYYTAQLGQHAVDTWDGKVDGPFTKALFKRQLPNLFTDREVDNLISQGYKMSVHWTGLEACHRAEKAKYNVTYSAKYCEFVRYK